MLGITEVIDDLYISGLESQAAILSKDIRSVINISSECPIQNLGSTIEYEKISVPDLPTALIHPYFDRLADKIDQNLRQRKKTLVHCYVGRSRSATIILAYLMKYKQMPLRQAYFYLRSRRPIIGPNFGFMRQLIAYERSLFGSASVSLVNTSFGSAPDIYLSASEISISRPSTTTIPVQVAKEASSLSSRPSPFIARLTTNTLPTESTRIGSSYTHNSNNNNNYRSSYSLINNSNKYDSSSFLHDQPEHIRFDLTSNKPYESIREPFVSTRLDTLRSRKYVPPTLNRYFFP